MHPRGSWLLSLCLCFAGPARADDFFSWVDDDGSVHYTDDESQVPAAKRKKARVTQGAELGEVSKNAVKLELPDGPPPKETPAPVAQPSPAATKPEEPATRIDPEKTWRTRFGEIHQRIRKLEAQMDADQKELEQTPMMLPPTDSTPNPEYARLKNQIRDERITLEDAKKDLDALDHEASQQAVPREWRR